MRIRLVLFLIIEMFIISVKADLNTIDFRFAHITNNDGISQQHVTSMMQDDKGLMWIGTKNGLCVYNGYEIKKFFKIKKDSNSLTHNFVRAVFQDKQKRIWVGTEKGICRYIPEREDFVQYENPRRMTTHFVQNSRGELYCVAMSLYKLNETTQTFNRIPVLSDSIQVVSLAIDANDRLWVGTDRGLKVYNRDLSHVSEFAVLNPNSINFDYADQVNTIFVDKQQNVWIGKTGNGVAKINSKTGEILFWTKQNGLPDGTIRSIQEDAQGRMWFGCEKGLIILSPDGRIQNIQQDYTNKQGLNDNAVYSLVRDRDDNMWIGTYFGGINIFKNDYKQFLHYRAGYSDHLLKGKAIRKIVQENNEIFWIATEDGGLNRLNVRTGEIKRIKHPTLKDNIHALLLDPSTQDLWIGMFNGGITRYNLKKQTFKSYNVNDHVGLESDLVFSVIQDKEGIVWLGTTRGLRFFNKTISNFDQLSHNQLSSTFIYTLFVDSKNNIWIGSRTLGLFRYNKKTGEIKNWSGDESTAGLADNFITTIFEDSRKRIWIGTNNGGLHQLNPESDTIINMDEKLSLNESCIYGILEDEQHKLWISTNNGLICLDYAKSKFERYTTDEGLPVNQFNYSSCLKAKNGRLYFGTVNGLISFNPEEVGKNINQLNIVLLNLYIGSHVVTSKEEDSPLSTNIDDTKKIVLTAKQARSFSLEYAAISLGHTNNISYAITLEGIDHEWSYVNKQRRVVYSGLPHGTYTFKVRASTNKDWENAAIRTLKVVILPPFYLSNLAFFIYFVLAMIVLYITFRIISIRVAEKNTMRIERLEKENIKTMNAIKIDFFTSVSHELKTPLTLIVSPLQSVIEDAGLSLKLKTRLQSVLKNTQRMVKLIEELITFNKIESGQTQLYFQKGNPLEFIEEIYFLYKDAATRKGINFELHLENNEEEVWYSLSSVEKIVNNLLSNAIKFTPDGGTVTLSAAIIEQDDKDIRLKIEVSDTGIGIVKEELENIFTNYYQTRRGQNFNPNGWGIGLALTQNLVKLHKGTITVESEAGKGTRFNVLLNVNGDAFSVKDKSDVKADQSFLINYNYQNSDFFEQTQTQSVEEADAESQFDSRYSLLVVDDNKELADFLTEIFSTSFNVTTAANGEEALKLARKLNPDLIISDIMMPVMDGITLCSTLKNDLITSHIPVILLTAKQGYQNIILGYESGADMYIEKPFNAHAIELQVQNMLRTRDQNRKTLRDDPDLNISGMVKNPRDEKLLTRLKQFVEENIDNDNLSVVDLTKELGISRTVLHVKMKNLLDMPISEYIRNIRLNQAKKYLLEGLNVSETAYKTGFSDPNYFSKSFKKKYGLTPTEFLVNQSAR